MRILNANMWRRTQYNVIVLTVLLLISVVAFSPHTVFASEITYPVDPGVNIVQYRDISYSGPEPPPNFPRDCSLDKDSYNPGETAILTIDDFNANLDVTSPDFTPEIVVQLSSTTTVFSEETGDVTEHFVGDFEVTDTITIGVPDGDVLFECEGDSEQAARAKITLPLSTGGNVNLKDAEFTESQLVNANIKPVIGAIDVDLVDGASFSSLPTVELSFANANLDNGNIEFGDLEMWHKAPGQAWEKITDSCFTRLALSLPCTFFDLAGKTITSDPSGAGFSSTDGQGQYVLAIEVGLGGGGGGGLVRPSLVVNVLAGIAGGAGAGSSISAPMISLSQLLTITVIDIPLEVEQMVLNQDSTVPIIPLDPNFFDGFDLPLVINDEGFVLGGFTNTLETQSLKTDAPVTMKFTVYESEKIQHFSLYTNLRDGNDSLHQSDTQILYNDGRDLQIVDPQGFFTDAKITVTEEVDSIKKQVLVELVFAKPMEKTDIIIRVWDPNLFSRDLYLLDAIVVVPEIAEETPTPTFEEPVIEELQSQSIPKWIKNNAAWWAEQQISDSDFVAGIEYLIKNGIINVPGVEFGASSASTEIPEWIKNNAGWWADSLITDDDFTEAMQWLLANGVIQI